MLSSRFGGSNENYIKTSIYLHTAKKERPGISGFFWFYILSLLQTFYTNDF